MNHTPELNMPPLSSPTWQVAAAKLASIVTKPMMVQAICFDAGRAWGWEQTFTINVLAAGEGSTFVSTTHGKWWRAEGAAVDPSAKVNGQVIGYGVNFKPCRQCTVDFAPRSPRQKFCKDSCRLAHARKPKRVKIGEAA